MGRICLVPLGSLISLIAGYKKFISKRVVNHDDGKKEQIKDNCKTSGIQASHSASRMHFFSGLWSNDNQNKGQEKYFVNCIDCHSKYSCTY